MINNELLEILACPVCKKEVFYNQEKEHITCDNCRLNYPVRNEIPVMLPEEAEKF